MKKKSITIIDRGTGKKYSGYCADAKARYTFGYDRCKKWNEENAVIEIMPFMYLNDKPEGYLLNRIK